MNLETPEVCRFLEQLLAAEPQGLELLQGGHWSQAFGFALGDEDFVVRFGKHGDDYAKDLAAAQFSGPGLPIPEVLDYGQAFGGFFCLSRRAYGTFLEYLHSEEMEKVVPEVLTAMDRIRAIDIGLWESEVGSTGKSWADQLLSVDEENDRVFGWHDAMVDSPTGVEPYQQALRYLRAAISGLPEARNLVHNDFLHCNVLVNSGKISAVFDWGNAGRGDFLQELAYFTFYRAWFPSMARIDWAYEARKHFAEIGVEVPDFENRLRCFECHIGLHGMAYAAFQRHWVHLKYHAERTTHLLMET